MIEGGKENEVQKKYRNGDECPDGSGNACRMRINGSTSSSTASGSASSASGEVSTDGVTISIFDKNSGSNTFDDPVAKAIEEKQVSKFR